MNVLTLKTQHFEAVQYQINEKQKR